LRYSFKAVHNACARAHAVRRYPAGNRRREAVPHFGRT
jgi:hypothetical protein